MEINTIGIDLAKEVFQVHAVDTRGHVVLKKKLKRKEMAVDLQRDVTQVLHRKVTHP